MKKISVVFICFLFLFIGVCKIEAKDSDFNTEEELAYKEFVMQVYPDGLKSGWNGIHATYFGSFKFSALKKNCSFPVGRTTKL